MLSPALEKLLIFQDRDQKRVVLEQQIKHSPDEIAAVRRKIEEEKAGVETAKAGWREVEGKRKALETEIGATEQKIIRFKSQQLEVKKNDAYQALGHEIEHAEAAIRGFEEEEIKVLYGLDEAKDRVKAAEAEFARSVAVHEGRIKALQEKESNLRAELTELQSQLESSRAAVPEPMLAVYVRLAKKTPLPLCVPIRDHKCQGCHLKVSSGVESDARGGQKLVACDNCGRLVYTE